MAEDNRRSVKERFGRAAAGYVASATHASVSELERIVQVSGARADAVALDIATGGGHTAIAIAPHVKRVIATDLTPAMLESAREHAVARGVTNIEFELADAESLPYPDSSFDLVTCRIAAHHFPRPDRFAREVARVLAAGGAFVLQDQIVPEDAAAAEVVDTFEALRDPSHARTLSLAEWRELLSAAGLEVVSVDLVTKRHRFNEWTALQSCAPETVDELTRMVADAEDDVLAWLDPEEWGTGEATFVNRHAIIAARAARV